MLEQLKKFIDRTYESVENIDFDKKIADLGVKLNDTYIPFGVQASTGKDRQLKQDQNVSENKSANVNRVLNKASGYYKNDSWDLCDAWTNKKIDITKIKEEHLPENMKKMTMEERKKYVQSKVDERKKIQESINKLNVERRKYIDEKRKEMAANGDETLDSAMLKSVHQQAAKKNFKFK